ncbi:MAG: S8 family serine peptidase [Pyrinomonadaceae bacterium]
MSKTMVRRCALFLLVVVGICTAGAQETTKMSGFWESRDLVIKPGTKGPKVRIGVWDSGVDISLFKGRIASGKRRNILVRGYDSFKLRRDTPMEVLPAELLARRDELNAALNAYDDLDGGIDSPAARDLGAKLRKMSKAELDDLENAAGRWAGYTHGTAVADIAIAGNTLAEILIARMEWWHGSPPVPCWTKELADREAESIKDLLSFLVRNGARVVNMSWGRFERSYVNNLKECNPKMPEEDRLALARYTVGKIRPILQDGMKGAPNVLFVGAAGNDSTTVADANPATRFSLPNFILVGAVDRAGKAASFTNKGPEITLYANGERIPARLPGGLISYPSGTSMATPNVANAAAKMLTVNPKLTGAQMREILESTADKNDAGLKLLHTAKAVEAARASAKKAPQPVRRP